MARRGLAGRIRQVLHAVFPVIPARPRSRQQAETPPSSSPRPRTSAKTPDAFERAWIEETLRRPNTQEYRRQMRFVRDLYGFEGSSKADQVDIWREFIKFNQPGGQYKRNDVRNPFWTTTGIHPDNFDWFGWREMRGYSHGGRKR
jgi:hypothetical protein